ncbi:hypothetical protein ACVWXM_009672 [Bradyrhizobium sp. GM7.3]
MRGLTLIAAAQTAVRSANKARQTRVPAPTTSSLLVDGPLIETWGSMKSVRPKDGSGEPPAQGGGRNADADFNGQKRSNDTRALITDPDARLYSKWKGKETKLCFIGARMMEKRRSLLARALTAAGRRAC